MPLITCSGWWRTIRQADDMSKDFVQRQGGVLRPEKLSSVSPGAFHLSLGVILEHILEMSNRGDVVIKERTPLDDFGANALLER